MLAYLGESTVDALFDEIPSDLQVKDLNIAAGLNEFAATRLLQQRARQDGEYACFIGAGAYEHHIPAAVWDVAARGEFMTAYTPYQAEASQGTLQLIYEFQTMMARLTGMEVANASLYDGATALAEAILMAARVNNKVKSNKVLIAGNLHPHYREVVETLISSQGLVCETLNFDDDSTTLALADLEAIAAEQYFALAIAQPNFFGGLESVDALTDVAHAKNSLVIAVVNPTALALLKAPGQWGAKGADIVCGEGQPLGVPLASGGPYFGFMTTRKAYVRQMPGRLVGRTVDSDGKEGFALTLQAREQHIRRGKAKSNICTNQGLLVTAATIYMSMLGDIGLQQVARASHVNTQQFVNAMQQVDGVEVLTTDNYFHEVVIKLEHDVNAVLSAMAKVGIQAGLAIGQYFPSFKNCLLVCLTETKTEADIEHYVASLTAVLSSVKKKITESKLTEECVI